MESRRPSTASARYEGRREMKNLALAAAAALEHANLRDLLDTLHKRVFHRSADELCETEVVGEARWMFRYKPMVELLLREIIDVTRRAELSPEEQRRRIGWALDVAGF
jgi:hypothetical protein